MSSEIIYAAHRANGIVKGLKFQVYCGSSLQKLLLPNKTSSERKKVALKNVDILVQSVKIDMLVQA
jgi:hypothetical protein